MKQNFFSKHKLFSYITAAILIVAAVAVILFTWIPGPIEASVNTYSIVNVSFNQLIKDEKTLLESADDFGMTKADAKELWENKPFWTMYAVLLDIDNQSGRNVVFDGFNYENKSGQHYFVKTASGGETGIEADSKGTLDIYVLVNCNELDDNAIDELLNNLDIEAKYYFVDSIYGDYPENPKYKTLDLELGGK